MNEAAEHQAIELGERIGGMFLAGLFRDVGQPPDFWEDPYVLGFFSGCAIVGAPSVGLVERLPSGTEGLVEGDRLMRVIRETLAKLSGLDAAEMGNRVRRCQTQDADFVAAAENAQKLVLFGKNRPEQDDDPDIIEARRRAEIMIERGMFGANPPTENKAVYAALQMMLLNEAIFDRLGIGMAGRPDWSTA